MDCGRCNCPQFCRYFNQGLGERPRIGDACMRYFGDRRDIFILRITETGFVVTVFQEDKLVFAYERFTFDNRGELTTIATVEIFTTPQQHPRYQQQVYNIGVIPVEPVEVLRYLHGSSEAQELLEEDQDAKDYEREIYSLSAALWFG